MISDLATTVATASYQTQSTKDSGSCHETLVDALRYNVTHSPDRVFLQWVNNSKNEIESSLSYEELWQQSSLVASLLLQNRARRGDRVMIAYPFGLDFLGGMFGCMRIGVIPCSVYPPNVVDKSKARFSFEQFNNQAMDAGATFALTSTLFKQRGLLFARLSGIDSSCVTWLATDNLKTSSKAIQQEEFKVTSKDIALVQYSSGSTGSPKGVVITHGSLMHNINAVLDMVGDTGANRGVCWLPQYPASLYISPPSRSCLLATTFHQEPTAMG